MRSLPALRAHLLVGGLIAGLSLVACTTPVPWPSAKAGPCAVRNGGCDVNAICSVAVDASVPICVCSPGLVGDGKSCTCPSDAGPSVLLDGGICVAALCEEDAGGCSPNATCADTVNGALCTCDQGYSGDGQVCEQETSPVDAGDGGPADGGDAGLADGGDAGLADGGDAGLADGGTVDAGPSDGGDMDAGSADGGVTLLPTGTISAGGLHSCAIVNSNVYCWGANGAGQLGNGNTTESHIPVMVSGLPGTAQYVAAGDSTTCAIVAGGAWCWGDNTYGELGNNSTTSSSTPVQVSGLTSGVTAISLGRFSVCALVNGAVECWGDNSQGELGNGTKTASLTPVSVTGLTGTVDQIGVGQYYACALSAGDVMCWGENDQGELGSGTTIQSTTPVQGSGLTSGVEAITAGEDTGCAIVNGAAQCWGLNGYGDLGINSSTTMQVESPVGVNGLLSSVEAISASGALGGLDVCAVKNGTAWCWGAGMNGALGNNTTMTSGLQPVGVSGLISSVTALTTGAGHSCAVSNGSLWCWGNNLDGELGNNSTTDSDVPVQVSNLPNTL